VNVQITNTSGTWVYLEEDLTSFPTGIPYTDYLLGPNGTLTFQNVSFGTGSFLEFNVTTPIGLDYTDLDPKCRALFGALTVDYLMRGLLTTPLPSDAFDNMTGAIDPVLDNVVSSLGSVGELATAVKNRDYLEISSALADLMKNSNTAKDALSQILQKYVASGQSDNFFDAASDTLGFLTQILDVSEKIQLLNSLTQSTFNAPLQTANRLDFVATVQAPFITAVSPSTLLTSASQQPIKIIGTGFTASSTLLFNGSIASTPARLTFVSANEIDYNVIVSIIGKGSVQVVNGSQTSNLGYYTVNPPPTAPTGSLVVNLSPSSAVGAQWQVNGTCYNSGVPISLAPGQYTVSFKPVSGYTTPANQPVTVNASAQTTASATYTAIAPTTYTLTLNSANGTITPSPSGTWNGSVYVYNSGSVVQLTAYANPGYHFTSWSGDASDTANPTIVTMNTAKNVTANFASGDPNLATMTVTIKPDTAVNAGVTWSVTGESQHLASGTSLSEEIGTGYTAYLPITLNLVSGWLGANGITSFSVPFSPGIVTNVTLTCVPDTTPGLLTVALSPPDAVTAGAHWHVNGGVAQGNGATLSLPVGNYNLTFDSVSGWTAPANQTVAIQRAQTIVVSGNYTPPIGQPAIFSISPPIGTMTGGTLMTINGVNFTAPATVLVGGQPATNVMVSSATQITCSTPVSAIYGSTNVIVQTASGSATNSNGFAYGMANGNKLDVVSAIGGSCFGVDVQGNYAYVGEGRNLLVIDVTTPSSASRVGSVTLPGIIMDIAVLGHYAYVADGEGGLQVVDISTPSKPIISGFYASTNYPNAFGVVIYGGRAYVADANANTGLEIFDLGNPTSPALLSSTPCGGSAKKVLVKASASGVFAYVTTGSFLQLVDVSNPVSPVLRGGVAVGESTYSIAISGSYVYAADFLHYLQIVDVSNTNAPTVVGTADVAEPVAVAAVNNMVYSVSSLDGRGFYTLNASGNTLSVSGNLPHVLADPYGSKIVVSGNYAFIAAGVSGFEIVAISNLYNPSVASKFTDGGLFSTPSSVGISGNTLCCASGNGDFKVFDVTLPTNPSLVGQLSAIGASQVVAGNGKAYVIAGNGIDVINIATPSSPQILTNIPSSTIRATRMALVGARLYAVGQNNSNQPRFVAVDVSNPSSPTVLGIKDFSDSSGGELLTVAINGTRAIVSDDDFANNYALRVLDISNISSPTQIGIITNLQSSMIITSSDGNYVYALIGNKPATLTVVSLANQTSPAIVTNILVGPLSSSDYAYALDVRGSELFVATLSGLYVYDISVPSSPINTRSYSVADVVSLCAPNDSVNQDNIVYAADNIGGIVVLREQDIQAPDVYITTPWALPTYTNTSSSMNLGGGSDDNVGVTAITWANNRGGSGQVNGPYTSGWYVSGITLLPGSNILTVTAFDAAGNSGSDTLTVIYPTTNQNQTITFPAIANHTFGDVPITLEAAASSGLPITFNVVSGPAVLSVSNVLTLTGAGAVTVEADQAGNNGFNPATPVDISFNVARANQSIAFAPVPNHSAGDVPFALAATTSSGLPVYFNILSGPAISSNNVVTLLGGGTVTAIAWQPGNSNYNAAATVQQSFNVSQIPQTITFGALSPQKQGDAPFPLNATANSGLLVSFSVSGPATLSGNIVTLTGHGTVTVTASQPGNSSYAAATPVVQSFSVALPDNTLVGLGFQNNSGFQMAFYGMAGSNYAVQASSNLLSWQPFTNFILTDSPFYFSDPTATNSGARFYRIMP